MNLMMVFDNNERLFPKTQLDANKSVNRKRRYAEIIDLMKRCKRDMTTSEIARALGAKDNWISGRITELKKLGVVEVYNVRHNVDTGRPCNSYLLMTKGPALFIRNDILPK